MAYEYLVLDHNEGVATLTLNRPEKQNALSQGLMAELRDALRDVQKQKEDAVRQQDFTKAGELRDREVELREQMRSILQARRDEESKPADEEASATAEPVDLRTPVVSEEDIAQIVA